MLSILFTGLSLWALWRLLSALSNAAEAKRLRQEDWDNWHAALQRDPRNASARAFIAERCVEEGDLNRGIHEFRTAINIMPQGPHSARWKRKLKAALELHEQMERYRGSGERPPTFQDYRVCPDCDAMILLKEKTCPGCGARLRVGLFEWSLDRGNQADVLRTTIPLVLTLWVAAVVFSALPLEWKGVVIIASVVVGGFYFLRSFDDLR